MPLKQRNESTDYVAYPFVEWKLYIYIFLTKFLKNKTQQTFKKNVVSYIIHYSEFYTFGKQDLQMNAN